LPIYLVVSLAAIVFYASAFKPLLPSASRLLPEYSHSLRFRLSNMS
jgi:hypothetical protein